MLRQAFTRPAFKREITREENGADFIQAIKNTQEAITTGKLYNRRGDVLTTSFDYQKLSNPKWTKSISEIYISLTKIRDLYKDGLKNHLIREHSTCLEVFDDKLSDKFNILRTDCLIKINEILKEAKLKPVESELI
jgi:hypothetical protein